MAAWPPADLVICWLVVCSKCIYSVICLRRGLDTFPRLAWISLHPRLASLPEGWGYRHAPLHPAIFLPLLESWEKRLLDPSPCSPLSLLQYFHTFLGCLWPQSKESLSLLFTFNYLLVSESHKLAFYMEASVRQQKWISHQSCQLYKRGDSSKMSVTNRYFKGDQYRKLTLLHNLLISKG